MSVSIEEIQAILSAHEGWQARDLIEELLEDEPEGSLGDLLWQAQRDGLLDLGSNIYLFDALAQASRPYGGEDVLALLESLARHQGTPEPDSYPPGWSREIDVVCTRGILHPGVADTLAAQWQTVPAPYGHALGYWLAQQHLIDVDALPDHLLEEYAALAITQERENIHLSIWNPAPWPENIWQRARLEAALRMTTPQIEKWHVIERFAPFGSPDEIFSAFQKLRSQNSLQFTYVPFFTTHAADYVDLFEAHLSKDGHTRFRQPRTNTSQLMLLTTAYAAICQALDREPAPSTYPWFETLYHHFKPGWGMPGRMHIYFGNICDTLRALPDDVSAAMIQSAPSFPWTLAPSNTTTPILECIAQKFCEPLPSSLRDYEQEGYKENAALCLKILGERFIPYAAATLQQSKQPLRRLLIDYLADFPKHDGAVEALVKTLSDSDKKIREVATAALRKANPETVLAHIEPALHSSSKNTRLGAAHILRALSPSPAAHALAQTRLARERTSEIKQLLSKIKASDVTEHIAASDPTRFEEAVVAILAQPATWRTFEDLGDQLIPAYVSAWHRSAQAAQSPRSFHIAEDRETLAKGWIDLLRARKAPPEGLDAAIRLFTILSEMWIEDYMTCLDDLYTPTRVGDRIAELLKNNQIEHLHNFEAYNYHPVEMAHDLIFRRYPHAIGALAPHMLQDQKKTLRTRALDHIAAHPDAFDPFDFFDLLGATRKEVREAGVQVFGIIATSDHIPFLEALLYEEEVADVIQQTHIAIARIAARGLDLTAFDDTAQGDLALDMALVDLPCLDLPQPVAEHIPELTRPHWNHARVPISEAAFLWMLSELRQESMKHHSTLLQAVCARLDTEQVHQLCEDLIAHIPFSTAEWMWCMQATLASPKRLEETGARLEEIARQKELGWGDFGVHIMERVNTPQTIRILEDWTQKSRLDALKTRARKALERMAAARGVDLDTLVESSLPDLGFDRHGERRFDYGARTICVRLGQGDALTYIDERHDTILQSMPRATSKDDADLVAHATDEVSRIEKELVRLRRAQHARLQDAMIAQKRWELDTWRSRYLGNPIMHHLTRGVLWGVFDADNDTLQSTVIVDEGGEFIDRHDAPVTLDASTQRLGVVHPIMLTQSEREAWVQRFADYEIIESFPQLTREVHAREEWPGSTGELCAMFQSVETNSFMGRAERAGWERGIREDSGLIRTTTRTMGKHHITLRHDGYSPTHDNQTLRLQEMEIIDLTARKLVELDALPDHVTSELICDLLHLTGGKDVS